MRHFLGVALLLAIAAWPSVALAASPPDPCGNVRSAPAENSALYPPGPRIPSDSQLGVFIRGVQPECATIWWIEITSADGTQSFNGPTDFSDNAWLVRPDLRDGEQIEVRAYTGLGPEWTRTYVVDDSVPDMEPWELDLDAHRFFLTVVHRRGGAHVVAASLSPLPIPLGADYAVMRLDDGTEISAMAPGWKVDGETLVDDPPRDGDEGCLIVEQRRPDGSLVAEYERCATFVVTDLRRCACASVEPQALGPWALLLAAGLLRRRRLGSARPAR